MKEEEERKQKREIYREQKAQMDFQIKVKEEMNAKEKSKIAKK